MFTMKLNTTQLQAVQMISWAIKRNLNVVPWSFQLEPKYIPPQFDGNYTRELEYFYGCLGVDGIFHEFPDHAREVIGHCNGSDCSHLC
jgi:glycerophosphoryl diester phosphodiesterase